MLLLCGVAVADDRQNEVDRVQAAADVLREVMGAPDKGVPQEILTDARCIAVVPSMLKGGFVFGANYGKGVVSCRTPKGWSAPAFFSIKGGSFGFQIGGQAVDLVMVIMNDRGMNGLLQSRLKLGADASVAAGPVGRHAEGSTDWKMRAEVLTYSRARGLFAGISLNGADVKQHKDATRAFYGRMVPFKTILNGNIETPREAAPLLETLRHYAGAGVAEEHR
jgi:lipid-binding SYLF domain-containing protein